MDRLLSNKWTELLRGCCATYQKLKGLGRDWNDAGMIMYGRRRGRGVMVEMSLAKLKQVLLEEMNERGKYG